MNGILIGFILSLALWAIIITAIVLIGISRLPT